MRERSRNGGHNIRSISGLFIMAGGGLSTYSGHYGCEWRALQAGSVNAFFSDSDVTLPRPPYSTCRIIARHQGALWYGHGIPRLRRADNKWRELSYRFCRRHHWNSSRQWFDTARIRHDHPYRIRAEHLHRTDNHQYGNNGSARELQTFFLKLCRHT